MKKILFACLLSVGTVAVLQAQDSTATQSDRYKTEAQQPSQDKDKYTDKDAIAATDLPAPIQDKLKGQDYTGWTVSKAHRKAKDGKTIYSVELTNGTESKKIKFDEQGNVLKEKG
jgi:guanyl-specific ribonuclease Sa